MRCRLSIRLFWAALVGGAVALGFTLEEYFFSADLYHDQLALKLDVSGRPCVEVSLGQKNYPLLVDSGSHVELDLYPEIAEELCLEVCDICLSRSFFGEESESPVFTLLDFKWMGTSFHQVKLTTACMKALSRLWKDEDDGKSYIQPQGQIGKNLLRKKNILFDIKENLIIASNNVKKLRKEGYDLGHYIKVPFEETPNFILLNCETDYGTLRFMLDTGATITALNPSFIEKGDIKGEEHGIPIGISEKFSLGEHDFGRKKIYFYPFSDFPCDGILGMDFIKNHKIYLDFSKKTAYIEDN